MSKKHSTCLPLLAIIVSLFSSAHASKSSISIMSFIHAPGATTTNTSTNANARKRNRSVCALGDGSPGEETESINASRTRRRRPPRRGGSPQSPRPRKPGLSNMCPPLNGPVGAPQLPVLTTRDPRIIERWLEDHVGSNGSDEYSILGFDTESIAKAPWMPERSSLPDGPATIQLSTPASCIIIQLSRCGDGSALHAPDILRSVINNPKIIKVGVGIDDDALELYRWSKESYENNADADQQQQQLWEMTSRFDIGCILPDNNPSRRAGIRELAQKVLGVEVVKSKKLSMSNWGNRYLSLQQISYAARDAWVSAAILERLQKSNNDVFNANSLMEMEFMKSQRSMDLLDERAKLRKTAKLEWKAIVERQKSDDARRSVEDEERKEELFGLMDLYRADQPPRFDEHLGSLQLH